MSEINIVLFEAHREAAQNMISALCQPRGTQDHRDWNMSIPAQLDYDPDLVIGQALQDYGKLLREWVNVQAVLTAAEGIRQTPFYKRVALIDAVIKLNDAVRDLKEMESKDETQ